MGDVIPDGEKRARRKIVAGSVYETRELDRSQLAVRGGGRKWLTGRMSARRALAEQGAAASAKNQAGGDGGDMADGDGRKKRWCRRRGKEIRGG